MTDRIPGEIPYCAGRSAVAHTPGPMCAEPEGWTCPVCGLFWPTDIGRGFTE